MIEPVFTFPPFQQKDRKKQRAERFGTSVEVDVAADSRKSARAARFGGLARPGLISEDVECIAPTRRRCARIVD